MFGGRRKSSVKLTKNQPFSLVFIFFCFLLLNRTFGRHHSHHRPSHYVLHHSQTLNNLTWWLHHLSLSLLSLFSVKLLSSLSPRLQQQQHPPFPAASTLTSSSRGGDSLLIHSNRKQPQHRPRQQ